MAPPTQQAGVTGTPDSSMNAMPCGTPFFEKDTRPLSRSSNISIMSPVVYGSPYAANVRVPLFCKPQSRAVRVPKRDTSTAVPNRTFLPELEYPQLPGAAATFFVVMSKEDVTQPTQMPPDGALFVICGHRTTVKQRPAPTTQPGQPSPTLKRKVCTPDVSGPPVSAKLPHAVPLASMWSSLSRICSFRRLVSKRKVFTAIGASMLGTSSRACVAGYDGRPPNATTGTMVRPAKLSNATPWSWSLSEKRSVPASASNCTATMSSFL